MAAENCSQVAYEAGLRRVKVFVKGPVLVENLLSELSTTQELK